MDMRLFYSGTDGQSFGANQPSLAAAPSIGNVQGTVSNGVVTFSATVTGDPSAGVQEVWATWTGTGADSGYGHWRSVDLTQDPHDSTHWTGTLPLPAGQSSSGMRFLVQAANGVGAVGLDTAEGDGYRVVQAGADTAQLSLGTAAPTSGSPFGVTATVSDQSGPVANRTVRFTVSRNGTQLFQYADASAADGTVVLKLPAGESPPSGRLTVRADLIGASGNSVDSQTTEVVIGGATFALSPGSLTTRAGTAYPAATPLTATLTDARGPMPGVPVTFTLPTGSPGATFPGNQTTATVTTDANGVAVAPQLTARTTVGTFQATVTADGATPGAEAMAAQYGFGTFAAPINDGGTTQRNGNANTPMAVSALLADGSKVDDPTAMALVAAHRVQIRWREVGSTGPWTARHRPRGLRRPAARLHRGHQGAAAGHGEGEDLHGHHPDPPGPERRQASRRGRRERLVRPGQPQLHAQAEPDSRRGPGVGPGSRRCGGLTCRWATPILHQMVKQSLDEIATAVASVPRRAIIERLAEGDASMSALADHLTVSLPAVDKHLRVLVDAGMVTKQKHGRTTSVRLVPGSLEELATWAMSTRLMWTHALDRLERHLTDDPPGEEKA